MLAFSLASASAARRPAIAAASSCLCFSAACSSSSRMALLSAAKLRPDASLRLISVRFQARSSFSCCAAALTFTRSSFTLHSFSTCRSDASRRSFSAIRFRRTASSWRCEARADSSISLRCSSPVPSFQFARSRSLEPDLSVAREAPSSFRRSLRFCWRVTSSRFHVSASTSHRNAFFSEMVAAISRRCTSTCSAAERAWSRRADMVSGDAGLHDLPVSDMVPQLGGDTGVTARAAAIVERERASPSTESRRRSLCGTTETEVD